MSGAAVPTRGRAYGRYEVKERLAAGAMGVIYRARDRLAAREVAYKRMVVAEERSRARVTTMFQREYDTLARLPHPNIVEVYDYGQDAEGPYYAMELLSGDDLTRLAPLPYREACRVLRDIASALALVHARRLLHRDVSPNNVRLTSDGRAKLIDFGALTPFGRPKELVGTPAFIAPECLSEAELDQRSDLYSLGSLAYWALTGRVALRARSIEELLDAFHGDPPLAPSAHAPGIPRELDALVLSMLARDPLARPESAAYVIDRLTALAELAPEADERRVAYSYLAHPPLCGRAELLCDLERGVEAARAGHGKVMLVEAAPGLGRSALLDWVALRAQLAGATVLRASGERSAGAFGVARKLSEIAFALYPDIQQASGARSSFHTYTPGDRSLAPRSAAEVAGRHALVIASVQAALLEVSQRNPLLIVVDDAHACDPESLALLASLAEDVPKGPLSLLLSARAGSAPKNAPGFLALQASAQRFALTPLREANTIELVQVVFGGVPNSHRLAQSLHAQSGGNPATAIDLARLLLARGVVRYTLGTFTVPHTIDAELSSQDLASAVLARLGDLGPHSEQLARMLSLHPGALTPEQLASAAELNPREVLLSLQELSARGVVTSSERGFSLSASSLRAALEQQLEPTPKCALHVQLARALLANPDGTLDARLAAAMHLVHGGRELEAAELVEELGHNGLTGETAARWVPLIEAVLAVYRAQRRPKEQSLALLIPLIHAGFYGQLEAQRRHIDTALAWMSHVCGMTLAARLRPYLGGQLALGLGMLYAALRRAFTPARRRLGKLREMLAEFVGLVSAGTAAAVSAIDAPSAFRFNAWLAPLAVLPKTSGGYLLREFCLATAEVGAGELAASSARYAHLIPALSRPIHGLDEHLRNTIYLGCLNGRAQAEVAEATPLALELADELGRGDPFFAPHAESARASYYANRGERDKAELHRARAELLALRGGNSWSAVTALTGRLAYAAIASRDAIALVHLLAELERLCAIAPRLYAFKLYGQAWLESLRGRQQAALALYEQIIDSPEARSFMSWRTDRVLYAALLNAVGRHARAKEVCLELLAEVPSYDGLRGRLRNALAQLALAEAGLGRLASAVALMDQHIANTAPLDNPLELGNAHRDRAQIALLAADRPAFDRHYAAMDSFFRATRNPSLIQQCDALLAQALRAGLAGEAAAQAARESPDDFDGKTAIEGLASEEPQQPGGRTEVLEREVQASVTRSSVPRDSKRSVG